MIFKKKPAMDPNTPTNPPANSSPGDEQPKVPGAAGGQPGQPDPDETAALIEQLQNDLARALLDRDEARTAHKQALADFQNFQRRAASNEQQAREQGVRGVLYGVITIVDHFDMALTLDPEKSTAKQVIDGVSLIKHELVQVLQTHGVGVVNPGTNSEFDPTRHEAVMQQAADGVAPGKVVKTLRLGYVLNDRLVRPAQVIVAPKAD